MKKMVRTLCLIWLGIFGCAGILLFTGCSWKQEKPEKTNLAFTVVDEARLPEPCKRSPGSPGDVRNWKGAQTMSDGKERSIV